MSEKCEMLEKCPYFKIYSNQSTTKPVWIRLYCMDLEKSEKCERKKIKKTGRKPPDNLSPMGELLPLPENGE